MPSRLFVTAALAATVAALAAQAAPAATPKTLICGQIKHGPHATYTGQITGRKLSGTTWTIFATGVPCRAAMRAAPAILRWWAKAKVDASNFRVGAFTCNKESDGHGSSGSTGCIYRGLSNIELIMTGSYTIAQLKQMFFIH